MSGAVTDRVALQRAIAGVEAGDLLLVTRLDRLARSPRNLLNILDALGKKGAAFRSLRDTWADTTTPHGRLMLTVLGGLAEFERELIKARTGEGRQRAKDRGVIPFRVIASQCGNGLLSGDVRAGDTRPGSFSGTYQSTFPTSPSRPIVGRQTNAHQFQAL